MMPSLGADVNYFLSVIPSHVQIQHYNKEDWDGFNHVEYLLDYVCIRLHIFNIDSLLKKNVS